MISGGGWKEETYTYALSFKNTMSGICTPPPYEISELLYEGKSEFHVDRKRDLELICAKIYLQKNA